MPSTFQDIAVCDYDGPQGNVELTTVESASLNRTKAKSRVKTMNRNRVPLGMQTGTREVQLTLTVVPELVNPEVNWVKAWDDDEIFTMTIEKGIGGIREQITGCEVSDVNDTYNESGEARQEVTIEGLEPLEQPE